MKNALLMVKLLWSIDKAPPKQNDDLQIILLILESIILRTLYLIEIKKIDLSVSNAISETCLSSFSRFS